jgi:hypothetical protein
VNTKFSTFLIEMRGICYKAEDARAVCLFREAQAHSDRPERALPYFQSFRPSNTVYPITLPIQHWKRESWGKKLTGEFCATFMLTRAYGRCSVPNLLDRIKMFTL